MLKMLSTPLGRMRLISLVEGVSFLILLGVAMPLKYFAGMPGAVKIAGFALIAAFAGAVGAAMSVRWTYIDPATVFNPFIGFQTVLIALIGGVATLWGPLIAAVVFSLLAETLRLQLPQLYLMTLGLLLILSVLYLPGGLASLRRETFTMWRDDIRGWWRELRADKTKKAAAA